MAQNKPVDVTFKSDGNTWVSILSFRQPEKIDTKVIRMLPGDYQVVGRRQRLSGCGNAPAGPQWYDAAHRHGGVQCFVLTAANSFDDISQVSGVRARLCSPAWSSLEVRRRGAAKDSAKSQTGKIVPAQRPSGDKEPAAHVVRCLIPCCSMARRKPPKRKRTTG